MEARRAEMELVYYRAISRARAAAARAEEAAAWWTEVATDEEEMAAATREAAEMAAATREAAEAEEIAIGVGLDYDDAVDAARAEAEAARAEAARHWRTMTRLLNGTANRAVSVAAHPHWRRRSAS
jgi:hypothetical protein